MRARKAIELMKQFSLGMVGFAVLMSGPVQAAPADLVAKGEAVAHQLARQGGPQVFSVVPEPSQYGLYVALAVAGALVWRRFVRSARKA